MSRTQSRRYLRQPHLRHSVALEAARLLYRREFKEYYQAKREAAKRHGCKLLPTNQEIHRLILQIADSTEGSERTRRLASMRRAAANVMEILKDFRPRLIGSVWTGHIRKGSDIDLHLYSDDLKPVLDTLDRENLSYVVRRVNSSAKGKKREFVHIGHRHSAGFDVEMTLYDDEEYGIHPTCSITGGPMARANLNELRKVLDQEQSLESRTEHPDPQPFQEILAGDNPQNAVRRTISELDACQGVAQNHYHHLDVYEHTLAVVSDLERMKADGFHSFPARENLLRHFDSGLWHGWERWNLLLLAAYLHDIGKPATASHSNSGRIRFWNHDTVGAGMVRGIGSRLGFCDPIVSVLELIVENHMTCVLLPGGDVYPSVVYRFFQDVGSFAPELLLLSLADVRSARGPATHPLRFEEQALFVNEMLEEYFEQGEMRSPATPVSSVDLETEFGLSKSRLRTQLLERLTEGYLDGEFQGREDGLSWASELLESSSDLW